MRFGASVTSAVVAAADGRAWPVCYRPAVSSLAASEPSDAFSLQSRLARFSHDRRRVFLCCG